jgi:hypothetical protein
MIVKAISTVRPENPELDMAWIFLGHSRVDSMGLFSVFSDISALPTARTCHRRREMTPRSESAEAECNSLYRSVPRLGVLKAEVPLGRLWGASARSFMTLADQFSGRTIFVAREY